MLQKPFPPTQLPTTLQVAIRGLVAELASRGLKVDYHSVWDFVRAEKLSFKKSVANAIDPRSRLVFIDETWTRTDMAPLRGGRRAGGTSRQGSPRPLEDHDLPGGPAP
jgi:hypothetical protein